MLDGSRGEKDTQRDKKLSADEIRIREEQRDHSEWGTQTLADESSRLVCPDG